MDDYKKGTLPPGDGHRNEQLWQAQEIKQALVHPDTNKPVTRIFSFAAYAPAQPVIIVGMLAASTPVTQAFWQWLNQSFNAGVFYANKNMSKPMSDFEIGR